MKAAKQAKAPDMLGACAGEIAALCRSMFGPMDGWTVAAIACGHSRDPDCFGKCLARATAVHLGIGFRPLFADRFVSGSSHPKEFKRLPPLERVADPAGPVLLVDDVATSGWHLEEAAANLRADGWPVLPLAWIGGTVKGS